MNRRAFLRRIFFASAAVVCITHGSLGADAPAGRAEMPRVSRDIAYIEGGHEQQRLDIYLPRNPGPHPLIVWVHGGAWRAGSKQDMPLGGLIAQGFAVASVDYRLSTVAPMPAQMHDIKAAIRFLRAHVKIANATGEVDMLLSFLSVWREENGKWRFLAWQSCKLPAPAAAK